MRMSEILTELRALDPTVSEPLLKLPSTGTTIYTALDVLNELDRYSSWSITVSEGSSPTMAFWSTTWVHFRNAMQDQLIRAYEAMTAEYDPISNYDMREQSASGHKIDKNKTTDTPTGGTETTSKTYEAGLNSTGDGEQKDKIWSETVPKPGAKTESETTYTNNQDLTDPDGSSHTGYHDTEEHWLRRSGNIGVTTSAQMILGELDVRRIDLLQDFIRDYMNRYGYCVGGDDYGGL